MKTIRLSTVHPSEKASWVGLRDLSEVMPEGWSLAGGSLVRLHAIERGAENSRSTKDIDIILDIRQHPRTKNKVGPALQSCGFRVPTPPNPNGRDHRWVRPTEEDDDVRAVIDVLVPSFLGDRTLRATFPGVGRLLATRGAQFGIDHSEVVSVEVDGEFAIRLSRPDLIGALYEKCSALLNVGDTNPTRHYEDIALLASLLTVGERRTILDLKTKQKARLYGGLEKTVLNLGKEEAFSAETLLTFLRVSAER